jgi:hypothetical protein
MAVPSERPDTPGGLAAEQNSSDLPLVASNSDILAWLDVLLKGKPEQQVLARTEIAMILEARGHTDDAEEAYWTNVQARATDRRAYERLISLYQVKGDRLSESLVRRQLDEVFHGRARAADDEDSEQPGAHGQLARQHDSSPNGRPPSADQPGGSGTPGAAHRTARPGGNPGPASVKRVRRLRSPGHAGSDSGAYEQADDAPPAAPPEPPPLTPPPVTATGPGAAAGHAYAAIVHAAMVQAAARTSSPSTAGPSPATMPAQPGPLPAPVQPTHAGQPGQIGQPTAPLPVPVQQHHVEAVPVRRRPSPLSPHPEPLATRSRFTTHGLIALEPATIGAFLLASFGAAAIIAFVLIAAERGFGNRSAANAAGTSATAASGPFTAASQLPPRCSDAALRFPALNQSDPRGSVAAGYRENGVDVDLPRQGGARLTPDQAEQVLGGWMAISLLMERSGQPAPTLAGWLNDQTDRPTLANAILAGRRVEGMVTSDEWATMRGWPATTCEGAFLHDPRNANAVRLMERVVAR